MCGASVLRMANKTVRKTYPLLQKRISIHGTLCRTIFRCQSVFVAAEAIISFNYNMITKRRTAIYRGLNGPGPLQLVLAHSIFFPGHCSDVYYEWLGKLGILTAASDIYLA
jgi:hypothetical protein